MGDKIFDWLYGVIARPVPTLNEIARERPAGWAFLVYAGVTFLTAAVSFYREQTFAIFDEAMFEFGLRIPFPLIIAATVLWGIVSIFISTVLLHLFARLFGGQGGYWNLFSAYAFATFPMIIVVPTIFVTGFLGLFGTIISGLVSFGLSVWVLILQVLAIRESHGISTGMSILAYILKLVILVVIPAAIIVAIVVAIIAF